MLAMRVSALYTDATISKRSMHNGNYLTHCGIVSLDIKQLPEWLHSLSRSHMHVSHMHATLLTRTCLTDPTTTLLLSTTLSCLCTCCVLVRLMMQLFCDQLAT